jgi:hypothetical protein
VLVVPRPEEPPRLRDEHRWVAHLDGNGRLHVPRADHLELAGLDHPSEELRNEELTGMGVEADLPDRTVVVDGRQDSPFAFFQLQAVEQLPDGDRNCLRRRDHFPDVVPVVEALHRLEGDARDTDR